VIYPTHVENVGFNYDWPFPRKIVVVYALPCKQPRQDIQVVSETERQRPDSSYAAQIIISLAVAREDKPLTSGAIRVGEHLAQIGCLAECDPQGRRAEAQRTGCG
jgi:hypothetical protein